MPAPATRTVPGTVAYLDHAATTPMHPDAVAIVTRHLAGAGICSARHARDARRTRVLTTAVERPAVLQSAHHAARVARLRDALVRETCREVSDVSLNGYPCSSDRRLPGNANLHLPRCQGDSLVMLLDARGVAVSTGTACSNGVPRPSHALLAMGADESGPVVERARTRSIVTGGPVRIRQRVSG